MNAHDLLVQLGLVLAAGWAGGMVARALRLPVMVGFLVAGVVIGPHTPGIVASREVVESVANLGVILLMFSVGLQFSLHELAEVRKEAVWGGLSQIVATMALGFGVARLIGWDARTGVFVGCAIALSSTAVMVRVLEERGELGSTHGLIILGILVVQDLAVIAMAVLLPMLGDSPSGGAGPAALVWALARAALFLAVLLVLASRVVPWVLMHVAHVRSKELFVLAVVTICMGTALAAESAGVELALGAFMAGLLVAGSEYSDEVLIQIRPLRDVFASVFFVSIGMLLDPAFVARHWYAVLAITLSITLGKPVIASLAVYATGRHARTSLQVGFGLAQIGEFSFVLASIGVSRGVVGSDVAGAILAAAAVTILLTPFVSKLGPAAYGRLRRIAVLAGRVERPPDGVISDMAAGCEDSRAVVFGYGRVGRLISAGFRAKGIPHTVVDFDSTSAHAADHQGLAVIYGDATSDIVLKRALTPCIEVVAVALPEAPTTEAVIRGIRALSAEVPVIARVHRAEDEKLMQEAGANRTIYAENLAGAEMLRSASERLGRKKGRGRR